MQLKLSFLNKAVIRSVKNGVGVTFIDSAQFSSANDDNYTLGPDFSWKNVLDTSKKSK